ncbi:MAG: hypothetical protein OXC79_05250 [Candidatus Poribacteria bacterium]|nr:hypothetical protein [Candidatus Poribacteria bacterium]
MAQTERKILMIGVLIVVAIIISCIFISDWFFNRTLLTETLVGILIGTPLGWIGAYVAFYTVDTKNNGE